MPPVAEVAAASEDSPRFPTVKLREVIKSKGLPLWQERERGKRQNLADTLTPQG
jgi:hypothetical protein